MGLAPGLLPGRVALDDGRDWFGQSWGSVPARRGRDAAGILQGLAEGSMSTVILVGADPLRDFPDATLADEALEKADFVVAVDGFISASAARADVVLPSAIVHERAGTTTNIEGRVSRLGQKLVAPGQCWPDWMIASELAERLGGELGVESVSDIWDEIERLAPSHAGLTRAALDAASARDGIVAPLAASPVALSRRLSPEPFDPMATPGIESVEVQGAPPRSGGAEPTGGENAESSPNVTNGAGGAGSSRPRSLRWPQPVAGTSLPTADSYSLRLVSGRRLYDGGVLLGACESMTALVAVAEVRVHPLDLEKLGVADGGSVRIKSGRGDVVLGAVVDESVTRGVVAIDFNLDPPSSNGNGGGGGRGGTGSAAARLIDSRQAVVDVRMETP
jgi:NADH-quinone oxidoreductase subunit G